MRREGLTKAAAAVREGKLVVLPTDTLYGVGADAFNREAVAAMKPGFTTASDFVRDLVAEFWPGPLTIILKSQPSLAWDLGDTNGTVALRMPDHDLALDLLKEVGPMAVSSANLTGWPATRTMVDAATQLGSAVFIYLDAGPVGEGVASTIIDCTTSPPSILREGAISAEQLAPFLPADEAEPTTETAPEAPAASTASEPTPTTDAPSERPDHP